MGAEIDKETRDEILQGQERFYRVELVAGWAVRDGLTGRVVAVELDGEAEAAAVAMEMNEADEKAR